MSPVNDKGNTQVDGSAVHVNKAAESKASLEGLQKQFEQVERKTISGAPTLTPKAQILDARDVQAKMPDRRVRWINTASSENVMSRQMQGYRIIPESEGGRRVGDLALAECPKDVYDARVARIDQIGKARLESYKSEIEQAVAEVAKYMRDKHGIKISEKRLLVDE